MAQQFLSEYSIIEQYEQRGKYKSALEAAEDLYRRALDSGDTDDALKALSLRAKFTQQLEEDGFDASLRLLHEALRENDEDPAVRGVLNYMIGARYYAYTQANDYRLRNNTGVVGEDFPAPDEPLAGWNLAQLATAAETYLLRAVDPANYPAAGSAPAPSIRLDDLPALPAPESLLDLDWTLLDMIANEALSLLSQPLLTLTDASPSAPERLLISADNFVNLTFDELDAGSGTARKLRVFQTMLRYHRDSDPSLRFVYDYMRLRYVFHLGASNEAYLAALERLHDAYPTAKYRDLALVETARVYFNRSAETHPDTRRAALRVLDRVTGPSKVVISQRDELRRNILAEELTTTVEKQYGRADHVLVYHNYRNLGKIYQRLYRFAGEPPTGEELELSDLRRLKPYREMAFTFPGEEDHFTHATETSIAPLPAGSYVLVTSADASFGDSANVINATTFQVSDLALTRLGAEGTNVFQVHDFATGAARPGVEVSVYESTRRNREPRRVAGLTTDADGTFRLAAPDNYALRAFFLKTAEDELGVSSVYLRREYDPERSVTGHTALFSDRHLYRPGQTLRVYGLTYRKDENDYPTLRPKAARTLILRDANYQEVASVEVTSDEFGRFHHDFRLPDAGLTGRFTVQTENGSLNVGVEEYKRPRFRVELERPAKAAIPGEATTVTGKATLFSGPAVNDAKVTYRVFLEEIRWRWWGGGASGEKELIHAGETMTDTDGSFEVTFTPDSLLANVRKPYRIRVEADVADQTGETHAAETSVGLRRDKPVLALSVNTDLLDRNDTLTLQVNGDSEGALDLNYRIVPVEKPDAALRERTWPFPDRPYMSPAGYESRFPRFAAQPSRPLAEWPLRRGRNLNGEISITDGKGTTELELDKLRAGHYRVEWTYPDGTAGDPVHFAVVDVENAELPAGQMAYATTDVTTAQPGETVEITLLTALEQPLVFSRWWSRKDDLRKRTALAGKRTFRYAVTEADRGGLSFDAAFLRYGRDVAVSRRIAVPWTNKELRVDYAVFRDELRPGTPERWQLTLTNADGSPAAAAALASMYDASLDAIQAGRAWQFDPYPTHRGRVDLLEPLTRGTDVGYDESGRQYTPDVLELTLPALDPSFRAEVPYGTVHAYGGSARGMTKRSMAVPMSAAPREEVRDEVEMEAASIQNLGYQDGVPAGEAEDSPNEADAEPVSIRENLQETAFWFPELRSNEAGELVLEFDSPEALTTWNFRVLAHDKELASVVSTRQIKTQKELMVLPNVPRFLREGDRIELTARVNNMTEEEMEVRVDFEFFDVRTEELIDLDGGAGAAVDGSRPRRDAVVDVKAVQTVGASSGETFRYRIAVPEGLSEGGMIGYRVVARAEGFSDGEQNIVPVLSDRTLVTVSKPFYLKRKETKTVELPELTGSVAAPPLAGDRNTPVDPNSPTLRHVGYTFQATTNPAWLALKSLPYLMEYPYDCTEQLANRYFANQLAYATVSDKPVLEDVFRRWRADSNALRSELERNASLKNALLTETPWVRAAQSESEQRARIGELFDLKKLAAEQGAALAKLARRQGSDGAYSWFPGGWRNRYVTQYVVETFGRMQSLGVVPADQQATIEGVVRKAIPFLDGQVLEEYQDYQKRLKEDPKLADTYRAPSTVVHYLYARSMFTGASIAVRDEGAAALQFYADLAAKHWTQYGLYEQALLTVAATRGEYLDQSLATEIIASLRERAIHKDEFGMYWKYGQGFRWHNLPIETHCRILEAFRVAGGTQDELDEMRLWLLTNKRTNRWPTTKATAAAVYALLNVGTAWTLTEGQKLDIRYPKLRSSTVALPSNDRTRDLAQNIPLTQLIDDAQNGAEAATGAFSYQIPGASLTPGFGTVRVKNAANELAWGGVFWQYTELASKVEASEAGPLSIERELFRKVATDDGVRLERLDENAPLRPGERVTVKLTVTSDREVDFVHVKDRRAATFEPTEQTSGYRRANGLGYYFAPGDLATNFFFDRLDRGTHTLEYDLFVTYAGTFSSGLGRVQCMYAPEFSGVTQGGRVRVEGLGVRR